MSSEDPQGASSGVPSIVSPDLKIVGNLKGHGAVQIDGTIEGDIDVPLLTVGEQGKIDGSTVAETVRIFGTVNGRVQGWCRKVGGKLENWRKLLIVKHSERRCAAAERSLRHGTSYSIDVAQSIFR